MDKKCVSDFESRLKESVKSLNKACIDVESCMELFKAAFNDEERPCEQGGQLVKPKKTGNYKDWDEFYSDFYGRNPSLAMSLWVSLDIAVGVDDTPFCTVEDYGLWDDGYVRLSVPVNGRLRVFKLSQPLSVALSKYMGIYNQHTATSDYIFRDKNGEKLQRNATHNAINYLFHIKNFACSKPTYHVRNLYAIKYGINY
jgi:integrase